MDEDAERYATVAAALAGHAALDDAVRALCALPADGPHRPALAVILIEKLLGLDVQLLFPRWQQLDALIAVVDAGPPPVTGWRRTRVRARATALTAAAAVHALPDPVAALAELDRLADEVDSDDVATTTLLESTRMALSLAQAVLGRDDPLQSEAWDRMAGVIARGGPAAAPFGDVMDVLREILADPAADPAARIAELRRHAGRFPEGSPMRSALEDAIRQMDLLATGVPGLSHAPASPNESALDLAAGGMHLLQTEDDPDALAEGVARMRAALAAADPGHPQRVFHLVGLAIGLSRQAEVSNTVTDLPEAEQLLVEAQDQLSGPQDGAWEMVHGLLADIRLRLGNESESYLDAVDALRTYFWQVLLQPDAAGANAVARAAGQSAVLAAHRCLRVNDPAGAVRALDAGRGLVLYAATERTAVPDRLRQAGEADLADRWSAATAGSAPTAALRREVLGALAATPEGTAVFDPPGTAQIRSALTELDLDALVYLVPATDGWPGLAIAVAAEGSMAYLSLPALLPTGSPEVAGYLAGAARRGTAVVGRSDQRDLGSLDDEFSGLLDVVCDWAWRAAMGPVIEQLVPSLDVPARRVPRLVLVPMGELALIPWQAARRTGGEPAIRTVAVSQIASARMLCRSAARPTVARARLGMIVGDPDTHGAAVPLRGARAEAYAIHDVFYRGGRYLGRLPDGEETSPSGAGTAAQVRAWLTATGRAAGGMLHLACHGVVDAGRGSSYLLLADGRPLAADELVALMATVPERAVGLVVLAACSTGLAAGEHDEAYSLGTAFLAAGACSVLSTQWTIPDRSTSLLMFMFHHHLMADRLPVWEALHRAQLWMIDPARVAPDTMPDALRRQLVDSDPADVTGWAAFLHSGR